MPDGGGPVRDAMTSGATADGGGEAGGRSRTVLVAHPSPDLYGSDRVLLESVSAMIEAGHEVVAVVPSDGPLVPELIRRGADVALCRAPVLRKSALNPRGFLTLCWETVRALPRARRLIRERGVDLVFVNTITNFVWLAAGRWAGAEVVCHVHEAERSASGIVRKGLYAPLLLAQRLVVNSRFALDVLRGTWRRLGRRATIVLNGVPGPEAPPPPRDTVDEARLLFIGRLSPRKGPHVALEALRVLLDRGRPAHLALLGAVFEGYEWYEEQLRTYVAEHDLTEHVTFLGFDPDVWGHMADADIVLVPSTIDEPFGNTAVEAMLAQRALVVSATSGLLEAAAGYASARSVPPSDPEAIADAVDDLLRRWPEVVAAVGADRELAVQRHAPQRYRDDLAACLFVPEGSEGEPRP